MNNKKITLLSLISILLVSCSVDTNTSNNSSSKGEDSSPESSEGEPSSNTSSSNYDSTINYLPPSFPINGDNVSLKSNEDYFKLFNPNTSISMELYLSDEVASIISYYQGGDNYTKWKDFYFPGDFKITIDGEEHVFNDVGVRMKGNTSRQHFVYGNNIETLVNFKISFKATFDDENFLEEPALTSFYREWSDSNAKKERKDRNLFGLEKLDLKVVPRNEGNCVVSEIYAYDAFRNNGLIAPHASLGSFKLKNDSSEYEGIMELIEPVDKQMIKRYFSKDDSKGDLYKCVYKGSGGKADLSRSEAVTKETDTNGYNVGTRVAHGKIGVEDPFNLYIPNYQLKTNDKNGESSDFSNMVNLINAVWSTAYAGAPLTELSNVLDIDEFINFSAVSYLLGGFDDQRYNYNNYYLYFIPASNKAIYIPYDWDWCMGDYYDFKLSNKTPFDEYTIDGGAPSAVYYSTFLKDKNNSHIVSYSKEEMQSKYIDFINCAISKGVLTDKNFKDLYEKYFGTRSSEEISRVSSYMSTKLTFARKSNQ